MKPNHFAIWLKVVIVGTTLIGAGSCVFAIPLALAIFREVNPEFSYWTAPWQIFLYICAIPCFIAMAISWRIATNIQKERSFSFANAKLFKIFSCLALGDSVFFFLGCVILWLLNMNHPGLFIMELLIVFVGLAVFVCTSALSFLVEQAAKLQEENDLTI